VLARDIRGTPCWGPPAAAGPWPPALALGAHPGHKLDNAADDHDGGADKVTDKQPGPVGPIA